MSDPIAELARYAGILPRYTDQTERVRETGRETQLALLRAMGLGVRTRAEAAERLAALKSDDAARALPHWVVVAPDRPLHIATCAGRAWTLETEGGDRHEGRGADLPPVPLGLHTLTLGEARTTLLAAPESLPEPDRAWGITAPLWGLRGPDRAGFGDFEDLRRAGLAAARHGAAFLGINPIHAGFPLEPAWASPYSPSHRRRLNPMHIPAGDGVRGGPLVDYPAEIPAKRAALRAEYAAREGAGHDPGFAAFLSDEGEGLRRFAMHQALSERHGPLWTDWPQQAQSPRTARLDGLDEEIGFHAWLQWRAHEALTGVQRDLTGAGMRYGLYLDLAVGTHPAGAETWTDGAWFARGVSLGAPPDPFAPDGQTWNLAPLDPHALAQGGFRILAETLRQQFRYARLLRIDHILGFDRAFWVPDEAGLPGAYVKMPLQAMLAVVRIETARAGATVIGEDLGNIPEGLQDALDGSGILGCRLLQFERDTRGIRPPAEYPRRSLASFGTHDLPTWAGWSRGADIAARAAIGHIDHRTERKARADRTARAKAFEEAAGGATVEAMHGFLARTRSALVAVQAEDMLEVVDQTNLPGTTDDYPNWQRKLPVDAGALAQDPRLARTAGIMKREGR